MTYCCGWKHGQSVYLIADSAKTSQVESVTPRSSFGESHRAVRDGHVEESLLKLIPISSNAAAAFAGNVAMATEAIAFLAQRWPELALDIPGLFSSLAATLGPFDSSRAIAILLASTGADSQPHLAHWESGKGLVEADASFAQIGSLDSYHSELTPLFVSDLAARKISEELLLAAMTALVQSYGLHDNLIDQNVGGLIFGLRINNGHVEWQDDTNYVLHNFDLSSLTFISAVARDNAIIVLSSATQDVRAFLNSVSVPSWKDWHSKWDKESVAQIMRGQFRYWVFLRTEDKAITVVRRADPTKDGRLVKSTDAGNGVVNLAFGQELIGLLQQPLTDLGDGSIPLRFNFRVD